MLVKLLYLNGLFLKKRATYKTRPFIKDCCYAFTCWNNERHCVFKGLLRQLVWTGNTPVHELIPSTFYFIHYYAGNMDCNTHRILAMHFTDCSFRVSLTSFWVGHLSPKYKAKSLLGHDVEIFFFLVTNLSYAPTNTSQKKINKKNRQEQLVTTKSWQE